MLACYRCEYKFITHMFLKIYIYYYYYFNLRAKSVKFVSDTQVCLFSRYKWPRGAGVDWFGFWGVPPQFVQWRIPDVWTQRPDEGRKREARQNHRVVPVETLTVLSPSTSTQGPRVAHSQVKAICRSLHTFCRFSSHLQLLWIAIHFHLHYKLS